MAKSSGPRIINDQSNSLVVRQQPAAQRAVAGAPQPGDVVRPVNNAPTSAGTTDPAAMEAAVQAERDRQAAADAAETDSRRTD